MAYRTPEEYVRILSAIESKLNSLSPPNFDAGGRCSLEQTVDWLIERCTRFQVRCGNQIAVVRAAKEVAALHIDTADLRISGKLDDPSRRPRSAGARPMTPAERARACAEEIRNREACARCNGRGYISVRHGTTFEDDSAAERALAYHQEPCPACGGSMAAIIQRHIEEACAELAYGKQVMGDLGTEAHLRACSLATELERVTRDLALAREHVARLVQELAELRGEGG